MNIGRIGSGVAAVCILAGLTGCTTVVPAKDGKSAYQFNRRGILWEVFVQKPMADVYDATLAALKDLQVKPITSRIDKTSAMVDGVFADETDFEVTLEPVPGTAATKMHIRAGVMGGQARTMSLFRAIDAHL